MDVTGKKLLIAESNMIDRQILSQRLRIHGFEVFDTEKGAEAQKEIERTTFDIILIDIGLRDISGIELLQNFKDRMELQNTPILMIANSSDMDSALNSLKFGADDYILKPFNLELVQSRLQIWLHSNTKEKMRAPLKEKQLLVVDDNEMNRDMLSRRLKKVGYSIDIAIDGIQALEKISRFKYDLVLLDIMMPNKDGFEVLEELKANNDLKHIPVIMLTALNDRENIVKANELGAVDYLVKPFNINQVKQRIRACLSKYE